MLHFAFKNLLTRPMRSSLALCGLTVAIMGMVGLFSVAEGIQSMVATTFEKIPGLLLMQPGAPIPLFSRLPAEWGAEVGRLKKVHVVSPEIWSRAHLIEGKPTISPPRFLFGTDIGAVARLRHSVYRGAVKTGRFLTPEDKGTLNAIVSQPIADEFKKQVGDTLRVDGNVLKIVGIYQCNSLLLDVAIIVDIDRVRSMARIGTDSVSSFYVEPDSESDRDAVRDEIKALFRGRSLAAWQPTSVLGGEIQAPHGNPLENFISALDKKLGGKGMSPKPAVPRRPPADADPLQETHPANESAEEGSPGPADALLATGGSAKPAELPIEVRSSDEWADEFKKFSADLDIFLLIMTSIGVTIAVLGIVNTMLMSVTERFIEFGVLKANGWSNGDVLRLITFESALLGVCGGVFGAVLGWGATLAINANWPTRIHLYASPGLLLFGLCFSTALGVVAGLYPALWASRMLPMDAIRRG